MIHCTSKSQVNQVTLEDPMFDTTLAHDSLSLRSSASKSAASASKSQLMSAMLALMALCCFAVLPSASAQANNTIGTVAGPGAPFTGVALQTFMPNPTGIAEDASGNIYIASQYSYYVFKVTPSSGASSIVAGTGISGPSNGGDGGPATSATLSAAVAVAVDKSANVYIVDANRIRVVNTQQTAIVVLGQTIQAGNIQTVAGSTACTNAGQVYPSCGDTGPASSATFSNPEGIYIDGSENLFIADTIDQEIRFINTGTSTVTVLGVTVPPGTVATVAGNGYECNTPGTVCGDGGSATAQGSSGAKLDTPIGVITDSAGNLYIGDSRDQRIRCVANAAGGCPQLTYPSTAVGEIVTYAGAGAPFCTVPTNGCGDGGPKLNALFHNPSGLWLDSAGNLYVADQWDNRIRQVTPGENGKVEAVCGTGLAAYADGKCSGPTKTGKGAEFYGPLAVILDSSGNAFIADSGNSLIREGSVKTGAITTIAGTGYASVGDNGPATNASLANPVDVKWDPTRTNYYYIVDNGDNRIREVNTTTGMITTVVGTGRPSQACAEPPPATCNGDNGPATAATLDNPNGIAVDAQGNLYIADSSDSAVRVVNMQSTPITIATVSIPAGEIVTVAGQQGVECLGPSVCGDGGPATEANVDYPIAVTVDTQGNIYISDYYIGRVRCVVNSAGGCPNTVNPNPSVGTIVSSAGLVGGSGFNKNGIPAGKAKLNHPYGLGTLNGDLIFDDSVNNRVRCVANFADGCGNNTLLSYIYEYALTGASGFSGDGGPAISAVESVPQGFGFDPEGNLYIGGGADFVVRRIDATTQNIMTVAGNPVHPGAPGFAGDGGPSVGATLDNLALAVNENEYLLIADQGNNRVREVDMVPEVAQFEHNLNFGTVVVGQDSTPLPATIQNYGLATLSIGTTQLSDTVDYTITSNTCQTQLPPGPEAGQYKSTCTVEVQFNPQSVGPLNATLTINTGLGPFTFNLIGTGQQ